MSVRDLDNIEREFGPDVSGGVVFISDLVPIPGLQLWIQHGDRWVDRPRMTVAVRDIVTKRTQSERVFIQVLRVSYQHFNKVPAPHVMRQVAEDLASEWVVAHVLDYRSAVGIGMRFAQVLRRCGSKALH